RAEVRKAATRRTAARAKVATRARAHTVRRGESLWTVARRNGTTVARLRQANRLGSSSRLRPGQKLTIPRAR
ncbi:MAG: CBM50, partial [uncultured Gemmatimonadetes bacterium]